MFYTLYHIFKQESIQDINYIIYFNHAFDNTYILCKFLFFWKFWIFLGIWNLENFENLNEISDLLHAYTNVIWYISFYHIFSGKYSSFEYLIKCQMPALYHTSTLYRTPSLYTLLFKYSSRETNIIQRALTSEGWYWSRVIRILPCFIHFIIYLNRRVYRILIIYYKRLSDLLTF
jgi:hypothetical protein